MVASLNENNSDALQILEVATNINEFVADVVTGIFGIEAPIIQSMLDWALFVQQSILENYEAQWTQQYREKITCDLLCIAMENCKLTPELLINYFYGRLESQLTFTNLLNDSLSFIFTGSWAGTEIVDAMILSQLAIRAQFGIWFGDIGFNSIDVDIRLGFNNANNDWLLICDTCGWLYNSTFEIDDNNWIPHTVEPLSLPQATYAVVTGWSPVDVKINDTSFDRKCDILISFASTHFDNVTLNYDITIGSYTANGVAIAIICDLASGGTLVSTVRRDDVTNGNNLTLQLNVNDDITQLRVLVRSSEQTTASYSGVCKINSITARGDGVNPFL